MAYRFKVLFMSFFFISTAHAFYTWSISPVLLYAGFSAFFPFVLSGLININAVSKVKFKVAVFFLVIYLLAAIPFRPYDEIGFGFFLVFLLFFVALLKTEFYIDVLDTIALLLAIVSVSAAIVFLFNLFGVDLPWVRVEQNFRINNADYYRLYPGSLVLSTQTWGSVLRTSGVFKEPGHFGLVAYGVLLSSGFKFLLVRYKLVALGGMLTFSPAFYLLFLISVIVHYSYSLQRIVRVIFCVSALIGLLGVGTIFLPDSLHNRLIVNNVHLLKDGGVQGLIEKRASADFNYFYEQITMDKKILGLGGRASQVLVHENLHASDYRAFTVKYGFIVLILYSLFVIHLSALSNNTRVSTLVMLYFLVIASHRSGMLLQIWFTFFIISACFISEIRSPRFYLGGKIGSRPSL